ncbi:MAG TPA: isoprenylcysteine carboxylmethyltransferase family protein [Vicinamibacterales bacterium]|nr:isoprenylcysteine carboxylmethyltransferase family protein [Vicinamibacterales bacterium]
MLAFRSILFVFLIPGTVAGYIPFLILQSSADQLRPRASIGSGLAACLIALGAAVLLRCVWDFFAAGRGTLAPFDPPRHLVVSGLYRFTRNPMYNGVALVLIGEAWLFRSLALWKYAALVFVMFNVMVLAYEEPTLESQFGESFRIYKRAVPRWGFTTRAFPESRK